MTLAVIGGTGLGQLAGLENSETIHQSTVWGDAVLEKGEVSGFTLFFLPRHGKPADTPPHRINYRANIQALADLGVAEIMAVTAVGSVNPALLVGDLVITDQVIDYTWGRQHTFFDDNIHHIDFTYPFDAELRHGLLEAARTVSHSIADFNHLETGCYACTQGPRLETAAEIRRLGIDGCDVVGMTLMPEASLAREIGIKYAGLSLVVNKGAGIDPEPLDLRDIEAGLAVGMDRVVKVLVEAIATYRSSTS